MPASSSEKIAWSDELYMAAAVRALGRARSCAPNSPLPLRRFVTATLIRTIRLRGRLARKANPGYQVDFCGMAICTHYTAVIYKSAWWRWDDDMNAGRSPFNFSAEARRQRRAELLARYLDGSLAAIERGECPPLPSKELRENAARILSFDI